MIVETNPTDRPSVGETNARNINSIEIFADAVDSLLNSVDSESTAEEFGIGTHSGKHDLESHVKVAVREGLDPSNLPAELADKTQDLTKHRRLV